MSFVKLLSRKDGCYHINPKKTNNMKNVVLIGASGFVGTAILNELLNRGHKVTAIVRDARIPIYTKTP